MTRYIAMRPQAWSSDSAIIEQRPTCDVFEPVPKPVDTGIVDVNGVTIFRVEDRAPIGFRPDRRLSNEGR